MIEADVEQRGGRTAFGDDERALSTPVTHALTIAITGLLMVALVSTASGFLTDQQEYAARDQVETIGNQLADDVQEVIGLSNESGSATVYVDQPESIVGSQYHVSYETGGDCDTIEHTSDQCLVVSVVEMDVSQTVPVSVPDDVDVTVSRANPSTFNLTAKNSGAGSGNGAVVPMSRTMRVGVGRNVENNRYSEVTDPTPESPIVNPIEYRPGYPEEGNSITFSAPGTKDPDGTIIEYEWLIDGAVVASGSDLTTYTTTLSAGRHRVTLQVEDDEGQIANRSDRFPVAGVRYNNDFERAEGGSGRCPGVSAELSLTNQYSEQILLTDIYVDPPTNVDKIEYDDWYDHELAFDLDNDGTYDESYELGTIDFSGKTDGEFISLPGDRPLEIDSGQDVGVSLCKFKGGGIGNPGGLDGITFGYRYWHDGVTNTTMVTPGDDDASISGYSVDAVGNDIVVSFDSTRQLTSLDAEIGSGSASTSLSLSDFSESPSGSTYQYEASFTRPTGTYYVELTTATDVDGNAVAPLPQNDTATILGGSAYSWYKASDWDAAQSSIGVVHQNYGDYAEESVQLGRPPGSVDTSLVSYWNFDGGSAADIEGTNDGNKQGSPTVTDGIAGTTALRFDGEDDYVRIPDSSSLEMSDDDQVTVSMWVNKHRQGSNWKALFQKSDTSYNMQFDNGDDFEFTINDGDWHSAPSSSTSEQDLDTSANRYYHVVGTFDGADIKSYIDGSLIGANGAPDEIGDANGHDVGIAENLDSTGRHSKVSIDDIRLYDTALNANQVKKLSNVTKGSVVTDKRTGTEISKHSDIDVNYDADIDAGETITLTVYAEPDSGSVKSETVTLDSTDSGSNTVSLSGINKDADTFWIRAELNSPSTKRSPVLHGVELQEGS